jgi:hypothetical protein
MEYDAGQKNQAVCCSTFGCPFCTFIFFSSDYIIRMSMTLANLTLN